MPTSADLVTIAKALLKRGQKGWATTIQWAAGQIDNDALWKTTAQGQLEDLANQVVTDDAEISTLRGQVTDTAAQVDQLTKQAAYDQMFIDEQNDAISRLQSANASLAQQVTTLTAQLAAATISPLSLVMIDTHLYGFSSVDASQAFYDANSGRPKQMFEVTDFQMDPPEGTT